MGKKQLEFQIEPMGNLVPFTVFLIGTIYICIRGTSTETGMILSALAGLMTGAFFVKNRWDYSGEISVDAVGPIAVIPVLYWLITEFFNATLESSGLVNDPTWTTSQVRLTGGTFCVIFFIVCAIYTSAMRISMGTTIPYVATIYPADVVIGASLTVLAGVTVPGGCSGDSLTPISDTVVTPAKINNTTIGDMVHSRLKYTSVTAAIACVLLLILGGRGTQLQTENAQVMAEFTTPKTLPMILPAVLVIFLAMGGHHLVESTVWGGLFAIVEALALRLLKFSGLFFVADGASQRILVDGVDGMLGLYILTVLLAPMAHLSDYSGLLAQLRGKLIEKLVTIRKKVEVSVLFVMGLFDAIISFGAVTMLAAGPTLIREIGKEFDISGVRPVNLMDCSVCTVSCLFPYMAPLVTVMTVSGEVAAQHPGSVSQATTNRAMFTAFYPTVTITTVLFAALTGWKGKDGEKTKS